MPVISLVMVLSNLAIPARAGDWPAARAGLTRTGVVPADSHPPYSLLWSRTAAVGFTGDPLVSSGRVYFTDTDRRVAVVDLASGAPVWSGASGSAPDEVRVYDTATGVIRWTRTCGGPLLRAPQIGEQTGYVVTTRGGVIAPASANFFRPNAPNYVRA